MMIKLRRVLQNCWSKDELLTSVLFNGQLLWLFQKIWYVGKIPNNDESSSRFTLSSFSVLCNFRQSVTKEKCFTLMHFNLRWFVSFSVGGLCDCYCPLCAADNTVDPWSYFAWGCGWGDLFHYSPLGKAGQFSGSFNCLFPSFLVILSWFGQWHDVSAINFRH